MNEAIAGKLRALLGPDAVERESDGLPRATPDSTDACAAVCQTAFEEGWKVRLEGNATWLPADAPADLALSTRGLDAVVSVSPADLVATVQAGAPLETVRRRLADEGMWLALDPPGRPERTLGSICATATSGPLRLAFGPVRDHVLGCTVVTGDGRVVRPGGRVVKNVAGYDLTKLHVGGFGAFGVLTEVHLRLRALPRADLTLVARGPRDALTASVREMRSVIQPAALELLSPALAAEPEWTLAARLLGTEAGVQAEMRRLTGFAGLTWQQLPPDRSASFWNLAARAALAGSVTFRLGVLADGLDETIDLIEREVGERLISAGALSGQLRWTGEATAEQLRAIRRSAAAREIPMTIERAPWKLRHVVGHFGAYREGIGQLVGRLRDSFDPRNTLRVALDGVD